MTTFLLYSLQIVCCGRFPSVVRVSGRNLFASSLLRFVACQQVEPTIGRLLNALPQGARSCPFLGRWPERRPELRCGAMLRFVVRGEQRRCSAEIGGP